MRRARATQKREPTIALINIVFLQAIKIILQFNPLVCFNP